jgi:excisionase family DNA binding protein
MSSPVTSLTVAPPGDGISALLTRAEVAEILRVDPRTIARWTADGRLRQVKLGVGVRTVRYRAEDIAALIDAVNANAPSDQLEASPISGRQARRAPA